MKKVVVENPILRGMNPDPSILKDDEGYLIAVSTFGWQPGIRVYRSLDLIEWKYETSILPPAIDLRGNQKDCSIWAPQISYYENIYYCVFTNVKTTSRPFKDSHNYLIYAKSINGPWSEPIYLNSSGFDPSLFHDQNGKKWLLNQIWDYRIDTPNKSNGIVLQELDTQNYQLIGERYHIFKGTDLKKTEAPHLYQLNGYYYLITAEGGTGENHSVTVCRSREITGPYELSPYGTLLTTRNDREFEFQCAGHASLINNDFDEWYIVYLMTRPVKGQGSALLGRETSIQSVVWTEDHWLRLSNGMRLPDIKTTISTRLDSKQLIDTSYVDRFNQVSLNHHWHTLRILPTEDWLKIDTEHSRVLIQSGESTLSTFDQHMIAFRQQHLNYEVSVIVDFHPNTFNQMAGLLLYLNTHQHVYFYLTKDEQLGKVIRVYQMNQEFLLSSVNFPINFEQCQLKIINRKGQATFLVKIGDQWEIICYYDCSFLTGGFTGNYIALSVVDLDRYQGSVASFSNFSYKELENTDE